MKAAGPSESPEGFSEPHAALLSRLPHTRRCLSCPRPPYWTVAPGLSREPRNPTTERRRELGGNSFRSRDAQGRPGKKRGLASHTARGRAEDLPLLCPGLAVPTGTGRWPAGRGYPRAHRGPGCSTNDVHPHLPSGLSYAPVHVPKSSVGCARTAVTTALRTSDVDVRKPQLQQQMSTAGQAAPPCRSTSQTPGSPTPRSAFSLLLLPSLKTVTYNKDAR